MVEGSDMILDTAMYVQGEGEKEFWSQSDPILLKAMH
jgi:hypothetical protein